MKFFSFLFILLFFIAGNSCAVIKDEQNWKFSQKKGVCMINSGDLTTPYKFISRKDKTTQPVITINLNSNEKNKSHTKLIFDWHMPKEYPSINIQIGSIRTILIKNKSCVAMKNGTTICFVTGQDHREIISAINASNNIKVDISNNRGSLTSWIIGLNGVRELIERCREVK